MRPFLGSAVSLAVTLLAAACGFENMNQGGENGADGGGAPDAGADSSVQGAGCGLERQTGIALCAATSMCPNVVVDTRAFPSCGFRIRGAAVDLVCGCLDLVCPMGIFANCAQATQLLASQTEASVCAQVGEGRCTDARSSSSSTSSTSSSGGTSSCDKKCLAECGGGAGCASVCNCP